MKALLKALRGKKTYALCALLFLVGGLEAIGALPKEAADTLKTLLVAGGLATLRSAVK